MTEVVDPTLRKPRGVGVPARCDEVPTSVRENMGRPYGTAHFLLLSQR